MAAYGDYSVNYEDDLYLAMALSLADESRKPSAKKMRTPTPEPETVEKTKEAAVILYPTDDHNGAYQQGEHLETRIKLMSEVLDVVFVRIASWKDAYDIVISILLEKNKSISYLEFAGHGTPRSFAFSETEAGQISTSDFDPNLKFLKGILNLTKPDATIVMQSCRNGEELEGGEMNFLQHLANVSEAGHTIIGSKVSKFYFKWKSFKPIDMEFEDPAGKNVTSICFPSVEASSSSAE